MNVRMGFYKTVYKLLLAPTVSEKTTLVLAWKYTRRRTPLLLLLDTAAAAPVYKKPVQPRVVYEAYISNTRDSI
jgi:hypothetical protein